MKLGYCKKQLLKKIFFKKKYTNKVIENFGNMFKSSFFIDFCSRGQRHISILQSSISGGALLRKYFKPSIIFRGPSWMYDLVLNRPLESFVQDSPREELATGPVVECLTATAWQDYHQKNSTFR